MKKIKKVSEIFAGCRFCITFALAISKTVW